MIDLPRVSVIITNYNYGRYLREALNSVLAQRYPNIECIIVDDVSIDDSGEALDFIQQNWPDVKIIRRTQNGGQTAAFDTGFAASSGEYVVFLDADDILLPTFVETHVFTHLSLRIPVGFTTSDMLQTAETRVVRTSWERLGKYAASGRGARRDLLRRIDVCAPDIWPFETKLPADFEQRVHFVDPRNLVEAIYAPTSGNCFRRDALDLFLRGGDSLNLKFHADTYLNKGVCLLSGAVLIDIPLTIYRIHGKNGFTRRPELCGAHSADPLKVFKGEHCAWRAVVDHLIANARMFVREIGAEHYLNALVILQKNYAYSSEFPQFESLGPYIQAALLANRTFLEAVLGEDFARLQQLLKAARRNEILGKRRAPRAWLKPVAELFLTLGRLFDLPSLSLAGERLWHH